MFDFTVFPYLSVTTQYTERFFDLLFIVVEYVDFVTDDFEYFEAPAFL